MYIYINNNRIGLNHIFPNDWKQIGVQSKVGFSAYYLHTRQDQELENNPTVLRYQDYLIVIMKGIFEYPSNPMFVAFPNEKHNTSVRNLRTRDANLLICFKRTEIQSVDKLVKQDISAISAIVSLRYGSNAIRDKIVTDITLFEQTSETEYSVGGVATVQILDFNLSGVDLSTQNLENIGAIITTYRASPIKNKVNLCCNWYLKSYELSGVDNFIAKWIAFETLCMENSSNIAPIKQIVGTIYEISADDASTQFGIGRIYGLRNEIVHNGHLVQFEPIFLEYVGRLIEDCLIFKLGMDSLKLAKQTMDNGNFDINNYLDEVYEGYVQ